MKLFMDTGNLKDIEAVAPLGIINAICRIVKGPVSAEVIATEPDAMVREGRDLAKIDDYVVIKLPFGKAGVQACKTLTAEGIKVNMTPIFSPTQALLSAKVGATYVSPFIGRIDDIATDGMDLIEQVVEIFDNYEYPTEVLVAS